MEIRIIVHGVTTGQDSNEKIPSPFIQNFYSRQKGANYFIAEVFRNNTGTKSCYTLYISRNVSNFGNRPGSYFAISVIIDENVCLDVKALYNSLSGVFKSAFVGRLLAKQGDGYKFKIGRFADEEDYISQITTGLFGQIQNTLKLNLARIDSSYNLSGTPTGKIYACNPADLSDDEIMNIIRRDGSIVLSDEIPLEAQRKQLELERKQRAREAEEAKAERYKLLEQERNRRESEARAALLREQQIKDEAKASRERLLRQKETEIEAVRKSCSVELSDLRKQIAEKDCVIREYNREYQKLAEIMTSVNDRMSRVEDDIAKLKYAGSDPQLTPSPNPISSPTLNPNSHTNKNLIFVIIGSIVLLILVLIILFKGCGSEVTHKSEIRKGTDNSSFVTWDEIIKNLNPSVARDSMVDNNVVTAEEISPIEDDIDEITIDDGRKFRIDIGDENEGYRIYKLVIRRDYQNALSSDFLDGIPDERVSWRIYCTQGNILSCGTGKSFRIRPPDSTYTVEIMYGRLKFTRKSLFNNDTSVERLY